MAEVALTQGIRSNLVSLQGTSEMLGQTTERLSTGRKVNTPMDDPSAFFAAANLNDRASGLESRLDAMGQAVSTVNVADAGIKAIRGILSAAKGKIDEALSTTDSGTRAELGKQYNELLVQAQTVAKDSTYGGVNLLQGEEELAVQFKESYNESTLTISGFDIAGATNVNSDGVSEDADGTETGLTITVGTDTYAVEAAEVDGSTASVANNTVNFASSDYKANLTSLTENIEEADEALINQSKSLNTSMSVISIREDFTKEMINTLEGGADKLTLADLNEEGANLLALQTSQTLGVQSLSLASRSSQAILRLVG